MKTPSKGAKSVVKVAAKKAAPVEAAAKTVVEHKEAPPAEDDKHTQRIIDVRKIMRERDRCRLETEDFIKSDILRERLKDLGVDVIDQKNGPSGWKFIDGSSNRLKAGTSVPDDAIRKRKAIEAEEITNSSSKSLKKNVGNQKPEVLSSSKFSSNWTLFNRQDGQNTHSLPIQLLQRKMSNFVIRHY